VDDPPSAEEARSRNTTSHAATVGRRVLASVAGGTNCSVATSNPGETEEESMTIKNLTRVAGALAAAILVAVMSAAPASADPRPVPDAEYFGLVLVPRDEEGIEVPIRNGDETLGFAKACWKHNFCNLHAMVLAIQGRQNKQPPEGPRVVYLAHAVGGGFDLRLRVVVDTSTFTRRGAPPDGRPAGVITAYCEGVLRCPDELNQA
jgi:hypothetical protein